MGSEMSSYNYWGMLRVDNVEEQAFPVNFVTVVQFSHINPMGFGGVAIAQLGLFLLFRWKK